MMTDEKTISVNGTELDFLNAVYDFFLEFDGVTMSPTKANLETEFNAVSGTDNYFSFTVSCKGIVCTFTRRNKGLTADYCYLCTVNNTTFTDVQCQFHDSSKGAGEIVRRTWTLQLTITSQSLKFGLKYGTALKVCPLFLFTTVNHTSIVLYTPSSRPWAENSGLSSLTFKKVGENTSIYKIASMLPYVASEEGEYGIDYFQFSVLCDDNLQKIAIIDGFKHCSTVPSEQLLTIDGNDYYSIATDTIVSA